MAVHELKILPEYYDAVRYGDKRFEIRKNDRNFHTGDILRLKEWDGEKYTGEELDAVVRYVYYGIDEYGLSEGYCVMSIDTMLNSIPRGSTEHGTQETKRIKKIIWEVLHGGYSIDTPVDQDWVSTKIFLLIDGYDEEEADNVADETCK